jgi:hypothetical protein
MKEIKEEVKQRKFEFKNISGRNVFTTKGRCMADETVKLSTKEGTATKGMEKCAKQ